MCLNSLQRNPTLHFDDIEQESLRVLQVLYDNPGSVVAVDTETTGLKVATWLDVCIGVSIAFVINNEAAVHYFPIGHKVGENISKSTLDKLKYVLENGDHTLLFVNAQFDILSLETIAIHVEHTDFYDIPTMAHLINENKPYNKGLDSLAQHYLKDPGKLKDPELDKEKKTGWANTTWQQISPYAQKDAELTWRLYQVLQNMHEWQDLPAEIWPHKQDLIRVLLSMKRNGVRINVQLAEEYVQKGEEHMAQIEKSLGINPASPKQMKKLLIDDLGLPVVKTSQRTGAPSFDKQAMLAYDSMLEKLDSPVAKQIKTFRGWQKAVSASYKPYIDLVDADGRLRCSYRLHGTATGRLSCAEPNLQQIPKTSDKEWNGKVKECFVAEKGYVLLNADFSQLELRLATAYAGEEELKKVFNEGRDIFTEMSKQLGMTRHDTKTLVYSMQYGAGEQRLMDAFNVSKEEAKQIRQNYFTTYPYFRQFNERCTAKVEQQGSIKIWTGRQRHFENRKDAYKAMNSVIQGGAADIVERIMVRCFKELEGPDCRMLLQVHDSITFEVKESVVPQYTEKIRTLMEDVNAVTGEVNFDVRFAVEVENWVPEEDGK
jgi:DNA polymerase-1